MPGIRAEISRVVGYTAVSIPRFYDGDSLMGAFVNDAIYNDLNTDAVPANDVDMVFNNAGGLRTDIVATTNPFTLTHGLLYSILPFGNATIVGTMTGAEIQDLLNQSATLFKGALQVSGVRYKFYRYTDALPGPQPWAWGAWGHPGLQPGHPRLGAAPDRQGLSDRHQRVPGARRPGRLYTLQIHQEHLILG